jgi:tRNA A-37 threonylcarbamoyl transferase component Bud32/tetratricopeptide (TPR) repeat protein
VSDGAEPATIGPFIVLRKLGEGGMGIVYAGYDVALDRKVALKLIRRSLLGRSEIRARMIREAQAMARLSHPNVVQVYQAGEHGDEIYVAMEYVEGQTLTSWLRAEPRSWQQVLRTVVAAGRGLAAAHAAGLVHRDFKPDNVLVSKEGRPCVLDFGLVHAEGNPTAPPGGVDLRTSANSLPTLSRISTNPSTKPGVAIERSDVLDVRLTRAGKALGTPAYMSPEQHFGDEAVGPSSDQFSFSITLYEALYGARPFPGATWDEIKREVRRGVIPPPPRDSTVPGRIFRILARGLAPTPDLRWPSLAHMLDALERDPRKAVLRVAGIAAIAAAAAAGSYALALSQREAALQCHGAAAELSGVWDEARASAARRAFLATGSPFAGDTWRSVKTRLDAYALAWTESRTHACEAHASGSQSAHLFDLRTACLARRRSHLAALVDVFVAADRPIIEHAVQATAALPSVDSCADAEALLAAVAPPDDPQTATKVEARRQQLARAAALAGTGQYVEGLLLAREVRAAAETLRYPPLAAEAALGEGALLMEMARGDEAEAALTQALHTALVHGLDTVAAEAAAKRIFVVGQTQERRAVALDGGTVASALVERVRDDGRLAALLHNNLGTVLELDGDHERARAEYLRTIDLLSRRTGPPDPLLGAVHHNLGGLLRDQGRLDEAREHYARAVALFTEIFGERHPMVAHPLCGTAAVDLLQGRHAAAEAGYRQALAITEATLGAEHLYLLPALIGLGKVSAETEVAAAHFRRAIAVADRVGSTNPMLAEALVGLAEVLAPADLDEARASLGRAVAVYEANGEALAAAIAPVALRAGQLALAANDSAEARAWFERALSIAADPSKNLTEAREQAARELARLLVAAGERQRACALLEAERAEVQPTDPLFATCPALAPPAPRD